MSLVLYNLKYLSLTSRYLSTYLPITVNKLCKMLIHKSARLNWHEGNNINHWESAYTVTSIWKNIEHDFNILNIINTCN